MTRIMLHYGQPACDIDGDVYVPLPNGTAVETFGSFERRSDV